MKTVTLKFDKSSFKREKPRKSKEEWREEQKANEIKLFCKPFKEGQYIVDIEQMIGYFPNPNKSEAQAKAFEIYVKNGLNVPLVEDSEFETLWNLLKPESRLHLTTQIKGIARNAPIKIYSNHPEILACKAIGATKPKFQLHSFDYLADLGYKVSDFQACNPWESQNLPPVTFTKYSHFALAELLMVCHGNFQKAVLEKVKSRQILMQRRMFGQTKVHESTRDFVDFDWKVKIEDNWFKLRLRWIDTCALHGVASYESLASASGTEIPHKKILDDLKDKFTGLPLTKADMLKIALQYPELFRLYAEGDLKVYEILVNNSLQMQKVYEGMGLEMKKQPKLTIGGTVKDLFEAALEKALVGNLTEKEIDDNDLSIKKVIDKFISEATASNLKLNTRDTRALLAKVEGGRCRNHQPILVCKEGIWIDIDISGCYGEGQRNQIYPIGNPVIFSYPFNKARNEYMTLRKWLKEMKYSTKKNDLVPGAWVARISSNGELKYSQDFFASWFLSSGTGVDILAKYVLKMQCNTEEFALEDTYLNTDDGELKIFENEIHNAVLTHDGLQWILNIASKRQRNELLDNLVVLASMHYPASQRIENSEKAILELAEKYETWEGTNGTYYDANTCKITRVEQQPHAWIGLKLDETITDKLLENRGLAKYNFGKKSPLEQMYKLCNNTLFGDLVSKFFAISNTCVGNNITARARALAWYMEKGLYGVQSITDGCGFNPNQVLFPGRDQVNGECVAMHRSPVDFSKGKLRLKGLGGSRWHGDSNGLYRDGEFIGKGADNPVINKLAMEHLQQLFPNVDVLHSPTQKLEVIEGQIVRTPRIGQFSFEVKDIYKSITSHGSANYKFVPFSENDEPVYKCRGYESKKSHTGLIEDEETINRYSENAPIIDFLDQLEKNSESVARQDVAVKQGILKINQYLESQSKYDAMGLMPGDNTAKSLLVVEFSISQFTFKTHKQYKMWKDEVEKLKEKTGQSLEVFFLNSDGTLNYERMVNTIDKMIADDILSPLKHLDPQNNRNRKGIHPAKNTLDEFRNRKIEPKVVEQAPNIPTNSPETFVGVKLVGSSEFDELFGFSESETSSINSPESFVGVKLESSSEFDDLFGFS
jgi:hypothetical protein